MLIRFSVANFLSFNEEVELSMIPGKVRLHPQHVVSTGSKNIKKLLKSAVIYGANASGKSNLIKAMIFARDLVVSGRRPRQPINAFPFKFDSASIKKPSKFDFEIGIGLKSYRYGFVVDAERIHEEWLYDISLLSEKLIFSRKTNSDNETSIDFPSAPFDKATDREFLAFIARGTRPNQLFLTESIDRDVKLFEMIYNWFTNILVIIQPEARRSELEFDFMSDEKFSQSFQQLLQKFDTGISAVHLVEFNIDEERTLPIKFIKDLKEQILKSDLSDIRASLLLSKGQNIVVRKNDKNELSAFKFMTAHKVAGEDQPVLLEVAEESDGTQRLFHLIPALMELINGERVVVVDELDRSLHPHISYQLINLFLSLTVNQKSQMIVTSHESSLLTFDLLRRDEIWFIEKDTNGASNVYSLEEFSPRYDKDIRKGYLLGRFGAIPFTHKGDDTEWYKV